MMKQHAMPNRFLVALFTGFVAASCSMFAVTHVARAETTTDATSTEQAENISSSSASAASDKSASIVVESAAPSPSSTTTTTTKTKASKNTNAYSEKAMNIYRMYNRYTGEHFYTNNPDEVAGLVKAKWAFESVVWVSLDKTATGASAVYRLYNKYSGDHFFTVSEDEKNTLVDAGWKDEGIAFYAAAESGDSLVPVYRQYNPNAKVGTHNFTTNKTENDRLAKVGWKAEGVVWYATEYDKKSESVERAGTLYRMYNKYTGEHFYTASLKEVTNLVKAGWTYEKKAWNTFAKGENADVTAIYRLYNPYSGDHMFTISKNENDSLVSAGWKAEGVAFYCVSAKATDVGSYAAVYRQYNPNAKVGTHNFTTSSKERDHLVKVGWKNENIAWYAAADTNSSTTASSNSSTSTDSAASSSTSSSASSNSSATESSSSSSSSSSSEASLSSSSSETSSASSSSDMMINSPHPVILSASEESPAPRPGGILRPSPSDDGMGIVHHFPSVSVSATA